MGNYLATSNYFFKTTLINTQPTPPIFQTSYFPPSDVTILGNYFYYIHNRRLYSFNITNYQMELDVPIHNSSDFNGKQFLALSWHTSCEDEYNSSELHFCEGDELDLQASITGSHSWNTGELSRGITINQPGIYTVTTTNGCKTTDTFKITKTANPIKLSSDTFFCEGEDVVIDVSHLNLPSYLWNNGSTDSEITINTEGWLRLSTQFDECSFSDSIRIREIPKLFIQLGSDSNICEGLSYEIIPKTNARNINWHPQNNGMSFNATKTGIYTAKVENECFLEIDSIQLTFERCECYFHLPNAFTPNGDNWNEIFRPVYECPIIRYEMMIYNRWGELLFKSEQPNLGWNGEYKNNRCMQGVYLCLIRYVTPDGMQTINKTIHLLR